MVVNLLLVLWVGYQLTQFIRLFMPVPQEQDRMQPDSVVAADPAKQASRLLVEHLAEMHLFGVPVTEQTPIGQKPIDAPDTRLKIVLRGTISSDDSKTVRSAGK